MAKKKRRKSSVGQVVRRVVRRRSGGRSSGGFDGFSLGRAVTTGLSVGVAGIGVNWLTERLTTPGQDGKSVLPEQFRSGYSRAFLKAGLGVGLGMLARKFGMGRYALAIASGGVALATLDVYAMQRAQSGLAGVDFWNTGRGLAGNGFPVLVDESGYVGSEYAPQYAAAAG